MPLLDVIFAMAKSMGKGTATKRQPPLTELIGPVRQT